MLTALITHPRFARVAWEALSRLPWPAPWEERTNPALAYERGYAAALDGRARPDPAGLVECRTALWQLVACLDADADDTLPLALAAARGVLERQCGRYPGRARA